ENLYALDFGELVLDVRMQPERALHRRLAVHACRDKLEHGILDYVIAVGALKRKGFAAAVAVVKAPFFRAEHRRVTHLAGYRHARKLHAFGHRVARSPALAPPGIRR